MKKRIFIGLSAMLAAGLILASCGSSPSQNYTPQTAAQEAYNNGDLVYLAGAEQWDLVIKLLNEGRYRNINAVRGGVYRVSYDTAREYVGSVLGMASSYGRLDVVRLSVAKGADINLRGSNDWTALMGAARNGHTDIVRYLVEHGANVNLRNNDGATAASMAYDRGNVDIFDYLMANGAREFEPRQVAQPAAPAPQTNVYVQPSAPAQNPAPAPAPSTPTFQPGTYAFSGSNITMSLLGYQAAAYSGYTQVAWGTYRINGNQLVISFHTGNGAGASLQGKTFAYTLTSTTSFSGNGETWVRTGY